MLINQKGQDIHAGVAALSFSTPSPARLPLAMSGFSLERPQGQEARAEGWARLCPRASCMALRKLLCSSLPSLPTKQE